MLFTAAQLISMAIGIVIPLINGLITKYTATRTRVILQVVLAAAAGFLTEWGGALASHVDYNVASALLGWLATLVTALATEARVWAPLGVSEYLKRLGSTPQAPAA
jgi:hypothetical protein